jgi:importin subunit alpha-1
LVRRAVPTLIKVLVENDKEDIITDICWALSYLSDGAKERIDDLLDVNLLKKMIQLLRHENVAIAIPCLRTIGNIVTGDDNQTQMAVDCGLIDALNTIISHNKKTVRKESCWVLSNITAGTPEQVQSCIEIGIVDKLVNILKHDDVTVKNEAVWALSNCTASATPFQFEIFVQKGMINALGEMFKCKDVRMLAVALEGVENILACGQANFVNEEGDNRFAIHMEQAGCLDDLEALQAHPNH